MTTDRTLRQLAADVARDRAQLAALEQHAADLRRGVTGLLNFADPTQAPAARVLLTHADRLDFTPATVAALRYAATGAQVLTGRDRLTALGRHFREVTTVAGIRAHGWDVDVDPALPGDVLVYRPDALLVIAREERDVEYLLGFLFEAARARRHLRARVLDVAYRLGFDDLRPFARPAMMGA